MDYVPPDEFISLSIIGSFDLFISVRLVISESDAQIQDSVIVLLIAPMLDLDW